MRLKQWNEREQSIATKLMWTSTINNTESDCWQAVYIRHANCNQLYY